MEKKRSGKLILILILIMSLLPTFKVFGQDVAEPSFAAEQAARLLGELTPEDKVGQLFLVTFDGTDVDPDSDLALLISDYHIGGIMLRDDNGNIPNEDPQKNLPLLIDTIQRSALESSRNQDNLPVGNEDRYIPLFIGISQNGGSFPYDTVLRGIETMPSPMSIGATWDVNLALEAGEAFGRDLETVGFNLLLGPSMDVLDMAYAQYDSSLGVRTFGGDPYWVGEIGSQFISGLHRGSSGRLAVIAKNFPGRGSTDRLPDEEVSTVRKSLEQLKLIELAPFFKITNVGAAIPASIADGLVSSHIRYQGFQGNIRATTKPVSFDQNALDLLMALPPIDDWRSAGGLLVSDDLGSTAIARFFDPNNQFIDARQVAKNAFLAGNDVLYMDDLVSTGDTNRFQTYQNIITFFQQKYAEDSAFAQRVDDSVLRILTLKYELYDEFNIDRVVPEVSAIAMPIEIGDLHFKIAQHASTLIDPTQSQLVEVIPEAPQFSDRVIIFTQEQTVIPCDGCPAEEIFPVNGLQRSILRFFGSSGSGQINENRIVSYSFRDLTDYLDSAINRPEINENLSSADWIIFAVREETVGDAGGEALHRLIADYPALLRGKNVIVFSFDAPYYFDATEIAAFTAYYGLYSKLPVFFDVAARILFQEITPASASPISIPGIGYDLIDQLTPDATQIISLAVDVDTAKELLTEPQAENSPIQETPVFKLGDTLPVITGVIFAHTGNPVPDGSPVSFTMNEQGEGTIIQQVETATGQGIARALFPLLKPGMHEIKVVADPAHNSEILQLDISEQEATVSEIVPTPLPIEEAGGGEIADLDEPQEEVVAIPNLKFSEWIIATLSAWVFGVIVFILIRDYFVREENYIISGVGIIGGLVNMVWMVMDLPGTSPRYGTNGYVRMGMVVLLGVVMGAFLGWALIKMRIVRSGEQDPN